MELQTDRQIEIQYTETCCLNENCNKTFEIVLSLNTVFDVLNCVRPFGSVNSLPVPVSIKLLFLPKNTPVVSL